VLLPHTFEYGLLAWGNIKVASHVTIDTWSIVLPGSVSDDNTIIRNIITNCVFSFRYTIILYLF